MARIVEWGSSQFVILVTPRQLARRCQIRDIRNIRGGREAGLKVALVLLASRGALHDRKNGCVLSCDAMMNSPRLACHFFFF